ncbi:hypothetical protein ABH944_008535 [Caballeronia udeis]|uniref:Uncharacterized protein n=1 Tax=Caballeronia udeis TaxID=1232866 RepID=A0ABW8N3N7_9BURK
MMIAESTSSAPQPSRALVRALLNALIDRLRAEPIYASRQGDGLPGWHPVAADCHDNADRWVALGAGDEAVRGWLHEPLHGLPHRFVAHSVVRPAAADPIDLVDVTLVASAPALANELQVFVSPPAIDISTDGTPMGIS